MDRTIQHITRNLMARLPDNERHYRPGELREWQFPGFIVKRIEVELQRNLAESMIPPRTDWADVESEAVRNAWQQFVDAIRAGTRLPDSYAGTVIETAVADVLEMLVQPRKKIPEVIFGNERKLTFEKLSARVESVVVYPHFGTILLRYMQKKGAEKLSKEKCREIIRSSDEKMTARYSPLNWAQTMDPLFILLDGAIDTDLLRLFFEDKNLTRVARRFDLANGEVTRAELIEILSSPELLNFEGYEEEQSSLFDKLKNQQQNSVSVPADDSRNDDPADIPVEREVTGSETESGTAIGNSAEAGWREEKSAGEETGAEQYEKEDNSLNRIFAEEEEPADIIYKEEADHSLNRNFADDSSDGDEEDEAEPGESRPVPEPGSLSEPESDSDARPEPDSAPEPRPGSEPQSDSKPEPDSVPDPKPGSELPSTSESEPDSGPEPDFAPESKPGPDPESDSDPEPKHGSKPKPGSEPQNSRFSIDEAISFVEKKNSRNNKEESGGAFGYGNLRIEYLNEPEKEETGNEDEEAGVSGISGKDQQTTPMWMRFLDPEKLRELEREQAEEESSDGLLQEEERRTGRAGREADNTAELAEGENTEAGETVRDAEPEGKHPDEEGYVDEPVIDLTAEEEPPEKEREVELLQKELSPDRERFVEEVFRGSERAFDEAVEDVATYDNWRGVSKYIEKVFKRNLVDMYSEAAVDFTDHLQTYFLNKQNRN